MSRFSHWTPRYIIDRLRLMWFEKRHPSDPWFTQSAIAVLDCLLKRTDQGLEFGSGRSTIWFARRVSKLTSVETNPVWHEKVSAELRSLKMSHVRCLLIPEDVEEALGRESAYIQVFRQFEKAGLDFVLVDGSYRADCAVTCADYLRPGGFMILDNANWYLPSSSVAPNSRSPEQGPVSERWAEFLELVSDWRYIWTGNGVTDTAIYFKPCS
jgi:predicted O-methyltransferase YrrM